MNDNVSFIGTGNMGGALIRAACRVHDPKLVHITNRSMDKARSLADELGCSLAASNRDAVLAGEYIFLLRETSDDGRIIVGNRTGAQIMSGSGREKNIGIYCGRT